MNNIELSIIVPVFNVEQYICKCIESIQNQTLKYFEAIIVDDGSTDNSLSLCRNLIYNDSRFRIVHKNNGGLMSAWKYGVSIAKGKYIGFIDSDDWIDSNMFEILLSSIKYYNSDLIFSGYVTEGQDSKTYIGRDELYIYENTQIRESFIKEYCNSHFSSKSNPTICRWDKIYRKDILLKNLDNFNESVSMGEDFNTNIAYLLDAQKVVLLPKFTPYHYRYNPKSIVNTINSKAFYNIKTLADTCAAICKNKNFNPLYVESFIGNMIFEELNRICSSHKMNINSCALSESISLCNGLYFLDKYYQVRKTKRLAIYNYFIRNNSYKMICFFGLFNKFIRNKLLNICKVFQS